MSKMLFVFNPHTGGGRLKNKLMQILGIFSSAGYEVTVHPTAFSGDARQTVRERAGQYDIVACCGGDGTLNEVVDGLSFLQNPPLLGYIPGGTTNDFASSLHLPRSDMLAAAERIVNPRKILACDSGRCNDRIFNYVAAFGAFTDVSYETPQKFKNMLGYFAYLLEAVQKLPNLPHYKLSVTANGKTRSGDFLLGMVTNSSSVGGLSLFATDTIQLDDGIFECVFIRYPANLRQLGKLSSALVRHDASSSPLLLTLRCSSIQIHCQEPIAWTLDGEYGGSFADTDIAVKNKSFRICV